MVEFSWEKISVNKHPIGKHSPNMVTLPASVAEEVFEQGDQMSL
jgi:hypothetical protein